MEENGLLDMIDFNIDNNIDFEEDLNNLGKKEKFNNNFGVENLNGNGISDFRIDDKNGSLEVLDFENFYKNINEDTNGGISDLDGGFNGLDENIKGFDKNDINETSGNLEYNKDFRIDFNLNNSFEDDIKVDLGLNEISNKSKDLKLENEDYLKKNNFNDFEKVKKEKINNLTDIIDNSKKKNLNNIKILKSKEENSNEKINAKNFDKNIDLISDNNLDETKDRVNSDIYKRKKISFNVNSEIESIKNNKKNSITSINKNNYDSKLSHEKENSENKGFLMMNIRKNLINNSKKNSVKVNLPSFVGINIDEEFAKKNSENLEELDSQNLNKSKDIMLLSFRENLKIEKKIKKEENDIIRKNRINKIQKSFKQDHKKNLTNYHLTLEVKEKKIDEFSFYNPSAKNVAINENSGILSLMNENEKKNDFEKLKFSSFLKNNGNSKEIDNINNSEMLYSNIKRDSQISENKFEGKNRSTKDLEIFLPLTESRQSDFFESVVSDNFDDIIEDIIDKEEKGMDKEEIYIKKEKKKKSERFSKHFFSQNSFGPNNALKERISILKNKNFTHLDNEFDDGTLDISHLLISKKNNKKKSRNNNLDIGLFKRRSTYIEEIDSDEYDELAKCMIIKKKTIHYQKEVKNESLRNTKDSFKYKNINIGIEKQIGKEFKDEFKKENFKNKNENEEEEIIKSIIKKKKFKKTVTCSSSDLEENIKKNNIKKEKEKKIFKNSSQKSFIIDLDKINKEEKIKLVLDYKKTLIKKMNKIFENNSFINDSQIALFEIQREMGNIVNLKFLIYENNLKKGEIEKIIQIQRYFRKIIYKRIIKKISKQNNYFKVQSKKRGSYFYTHCVILKNKK